MGQIYTAKSNLAGQNVYCKNELKAIKYIRENKTSLGKIYIIKSGFDEQSIYCKR